MRRQTLKKLFSVEMFILYTALVTGAVVFSFPFVWMIAASFKTTSEMGGAEAPLWPGAPVPQPKTPYIDTSAFDPPRPFHGIDDADWPALRDDLRAYFMERIQVWTPHVPEGPVDHAVGPLDDEAYRDEMIEALFRLVSERLSDEARSQGPDAVLAEADRLVDDDMLVRALDRIYRRACIGTVRLRTTDYRTHIATKDDAWTVAGGNAELNPRRQQEKDFQMIAARFGDNSKSVTPRLTPAGDFKAADIDRIMVSCRADETWARVGFEVTRAGQRYRTPGVISFSDERWREIQLRWPDASEDKVQRRVYYTLQHVGPAPPGSDPFSIDMAITHNTTIGAWIDKVLNQYRTVFREIPFGRYIMTSLSLSILSIVLMVFSSTLAAYAFARLNWPGRDLCFVIMLATMMIPPQVTMIPSFLIFKSVGWYDTLLPLWAPAAFGAPFFIFLLRQFLKTIPRDLEDAARIDGCGFLRVYWHVMVPLVTPTIAIIAVYTFIATWNNFMGPLIYVNDERLFPLALGLFKFNLRAGPDVGMVMAASFVMTLPVIILFFFVQRYFIQGVTLTGMKG
jgi:ABC-type glycerol-3-phosphate transport system permease component